MAVTYKSPYHCPEDPGGLVQETLAMGSGFPGPAEDILLSWSLRLAEGLAPQTAAQRLLERIGLEQGPPPDGACGQLVTLLRQAAEAGPSRPGPRRRGGWRARRN